jgi:hypothetical protein
MDRGWWIFWATVVGLGWFGGYVIACAVYPFAACRRCDGDGKIRSPSGRAWRRCKRCKGSGARVRFGRRVWTALAKVKKAAID